MDYKFQRKRLNEIPESKILEELEKAAKYFNYTEFGWRELSKVADLSGTTVKRHFGTWKKGLEVLRKHLQEKGLDLSKRPYSPNRIYSDKELFDEMEHVWQKVGQRPSRTEWEMSDPKISYGTYKRRFGRWTDACMKFIEYKMGAVILVDSDNDSNIEQSLEIKNNGKSKDVSSRTVSLSTRLKVLDRDVYKCVLCGRSPATDIGVQLHIDHKIPFSKGGSSTIDNLQTLCKDCNLGKSDGMYSR